MAGEENYIEHALHVGEELTGLSLEQLGFEPRLEDLTEDQRNLLDADDLEWISSITPEQRDQRLFQAKLLAGCLWEASAVLIGQLFEDLDCLLRLDRIDRQDIANTFVLSGLPPRQADKYSRLSTYSTFPQFRGGFCVEVTRLPGRNVPSRESGPQPVSTRVRV